MLEQQAAPGTQITLRDKGDIVDMYANAGSGQLHPMRGFDPDYTDIVDYIVRITHRIWEEKAVGLIYDTYGHNVSVWSTEGLSKGRENVVSHTLGSLSAFPHVRIFIDEVVWSGNEDDGYHTSMLATSIRINTGHSHYGPPTGRRVVRRAIANCLVRENRIVEEWLVQDELSVIQQLGFDPFAQAARLARAETAAGTRRPRVGQDERTVGQLVPQSYPAKATTGGEFDAEDFVRRMMHEVWNRRMLNMVNDFYVPETLGHMPSGREVRGTGDLKVYILGLLGAFPDAALTVDHFYAMPDGRGGYRTAVRWSLVGTHSGPGPYGLPTGRQVYLMGITQHRIGGGKIIEEWMVFDEFALLKQLVPTE